MATPDGSSIRNFRIRRFGLSIAEFAEKAELSPQTLSRAEKGMEVSDLTLSKIASTIGELLNKPFATGQITSTFQHRKIVSINDGRFAEVVREALKRNKLTQRNLAEMIGVEPTTVSRWVTGRARPSPHNLIAIYRSLGIDASEMEASGINFRAEQSPSSRPQRLATTAQSIPEQNPLIRFGVSENAKLNLIPTLVDENDYKTIEALRSELLTAKGPIDCLKERYAKNKNVPQASLFAPLTSKYDEELSKDPKDINYTILYARGSRFYAARRTAAQQVASGEWPELDAEEAEAIDAICDLHGPLIMASAVGRKIVEDAHRYEVPPDVYERDQETIEEFGQMIAAETEIMEPEAAEAYKELTVRTEGDPQPARTRGLSIAATGSALTVIVGGAAWFGAGGAVATLIVPAATVGAAGLVGGFFWEAIKSMPRFKRATSLAGERFEKALDQAERHADQKERALLERMAGVVERRRDLFEKVSNLRPEFGWAKKYIEKAPTDAPMSRIDLAQVVRSAAKPFTQRADAPVIKFVESGLTSGIYVQGNQSLLANLFSELLQNAVHHSRTDSEIEISIKAIDFSKKPTGASAIVWIRDQGVGIQPNIQDKILELGTTTNPTGAGTGLYIANQIVRQHKGTLNINSEWGEGTTAIVEIPTY